MKSYMKVNEREIREVEQRIDYLSRYMASISPKLSIYAKLKEELKQKKARLAELTK